MIIYEAEKSCIEHPVTIVQELKKQGELKWNMTYSNSQFSNEIFSNLKIVIFDFPLRYQPGQLYQSQNITAFISSMVTSACNYDISLDFPLSSINCNDC